MKRTMKKTAPKKAVMTIATVAAIAYGGYTAAAALKGAGASSLGSTAFWKGTASGLFGTGISGSTLLQGAGLVSNVYGQAQQQKYAGNAAEAERDRATEAKKINDINQRVSDVQAARARIAQTRENRIRVGSIQASTSGTALGPVGTSSVIGSIGSLNTQTSTNIGYINQEQQFSGQKTDAANAMGGCASDVYSNTTAAAGWKDISSQGASIFKDFGGTESAKKLFDSFSIG